ncbi:MAG: pantoate--beta-alanine ligase [Thermodesulfobacteriota bacterium]|nr:pantoate--beta-alanine ligase [Thermodesulfobacteriota bacterium]
MKIFKKVAEMQAWSESIKKSGKKICLVPTMGYFHKGHLSLMEKGRELCSVLVVSLFVNPAQFGENEDLDAYPSDIEKDITLARDLGVSAIFLPDGNEIYPNGYQTYVELSNLPHHMCGLSRPVHFRGVATVVTKLFNIVKPDVAVFGLKDFQQFQVIRRMTADLHYNIEIIGGPIVREDDGLAMSSRNAYLLPEHRDAALTLSNSLKMAKEMIAKGSSADAVRKKIKEYIESFPYTSIDYISLCDPETLEDVTSLKGDLLVALAVKVGKTRLIDNMIIDPAE